MKKQYIIATLLLLAAGLQTINAQRAMQVWSGGKYELFPIANVDSVRFVCLVMDIFLSQEVLEMKEGETKQLTASVYPIDADERTVLWTSSNPAIASVDGNGLVTAVGAGTSVIAATATDCSGVKAECQVTVTSGTVPDPGEHTWVDLGLPSGTLWAACNVGASSPEDYGDYFAWGETEPKSDYSWSTYKYCNGSNTTLTKYCASSNYGYNGFTDTLTELLPEDDAATANWGSPWHMPTLEQMKELYNNCTQEWTTQSNINGILMTGPNGNTIFFPAAAYCWDKSRNVAGKYGHYWSSSLNSSDSYYACYLFFRSGLSTWTIDYRNRGLPVRPVRVKN